MANLDCPENATYLADCGSSFDGVNSCSHENDVGVSCSTVELTAAAEGM